MYLGRTLACGRTSQGETFLYYRLCSRSFKDRKFSIDSRRILVVPSSAGSADFGNPYVTYSCCRYDQRICALGNGGHTDPIFEKAKRGAAPRDAISSALLGMDYEFDGHNTPRIALLANVELGSIHFGIITKDSIQIEPVELAAGQLAILSTNEYNYVDRRRIFEGFEPGSLREAADYLVNGEIFRSHEHGLTGLAIQLHPSFPVESRSL